MRTHPGAVTLATVFGTDEEPPPQSRTGDAGVAPTAGEPAGGSAGGPREGLILLLFAILTIAASAYVLVNEEQDAAGDPKQKAARGEIRGLSKLSLVREANLRKVLARVDRSKRPFVTTIRVAPDRVNLTVRDPDGYRKVVNYDPAFGKTESDFGVGEDTAVRASSIDAAAPERMLRIVAKRTELGANAVDYVTLSVSGESARDRTWFLSLKQGPARVRQWIAANDGSDVRKPGEPSAAQKAADAKRQRAYERQQRIFKRRSACLSRATTAEQLQRCVDRYQP